MRRVSGGEMVMGVSIVVLNFGMVRDFDDFTVLVVVDVV